MRQKTGKMITPIQTNSKKSYANQLIKINMHRGKKSGQKQ